MDSRRNQFTKEYTNCTGLIKKWTEKTPLRSSLRGQSGNHNCPDRYERRANVVLDGRVEALEPERLLRLRAEMKLPGTGWLQFEIESASEGRSRLVQTAYFAPKGLAGLAYWYLLPPFHDLIFSHLAEIIEKGEE